MNTSMIRGWLEDSLDFLLNDKKIPWRREPESEYWYDPRWKFAWGLLAGWGTRKGKYRHYRILVHKEVPRRIIALHLGEMKVLSLDIKTGEVSIPDYPDRIGGEGKRVVEQLFYKFKANATIIRVQPKRQRPRPKFNYWKVVLKKDLDRILQERKQVIARRRKYGVPIRRYYSDLWAKWNDGSFGTEFSARMQPLIDLGFTIRAINGFFFQESWISPIPANTATNIVERPGYYERRLEIPPDTIIADKKERGDSAMVYKLVGNRHDGHNHNHRDRWNNTDNIIGLAGKDESGQLWAHRLPPQAKYWKIDTMERWLMEAGKLDNIVMET